MRLIDIKRVNGQVVFDPSVLEIDLAASGGAETVAFRNLDDQEGHWITMVGKERNFWFSRALSRSTGTNPNVSSRLVFLNVPSEPVRYHCTRHEEQGEIRIK